MLCNIKETAEYSAYTWLTCHSVISFLRSFHSMISSCDSPKLGWILGMDKSGTLRK
jgi:hypothetical protein